MERSSNNLGQTLRIVLNVLHIHVNVKGYLMCSRCSVDFRNNKAHDGRDSQEYKEFPETKHLLVPYLVVARTHVIS